MRRLRWVMRRTPQSPASRAGAVRGDSFHPTSSLSRTPNGDAANAACSSKGTASRSWATCCKRVNSSATKIKKKKSSVAFQLSPWRRCRLSITVNKLCTKNWDTFLFFHLKCFTNVLRSYKGPHQMLQFFFPWFILQFFLQERPLINETGQKGL